MSRSSSELKELASGPIGRLLIAYSWPALVAMTLNALYAVVDRVFIGHGCGKDAMAGVQLALPAMMLLTSFGPLIGVGHAALLSIKLGLGDRESCEKLVGQTIALKLLLYAVLIPFLYLFLDGVLGLCGAEKVTEGARLAARSYLQIILFSHLFSHLAFGLSALQRAEGGAVRSMMCMVVGFGVNLILDPIFIFPSGHVCFTFFGRAIDMPFRGLGLGVSGAAWATDISMAASCLTAFAFYWCGRTAVKLRWARVRIYPELLGRALSIGLAPFLQQLMSAVIVASLQIAFTKWIAGEDACTAEIASLGVFSSVLIFVFMPMLGCQQGLQPILGYNWGARNYRRVLAALKTGFWVTSVLTVLACLIQVVPPFPTYLARLFVSGDDPDLIRLAAHDLTLSNCMIWTISINVVATTYFQSIGKPLVAILLSMLRQGVVLLPVIWILPYFMDDKATAIWLSMPISDVICQLATLFPLYLHVRFLASVRDRRPDALPGGAA